MAIEENDVVLTRKLMEWKDTENKVRSQKKLKNEKTTFYK